jgi:hypothetical protein
MGPALTIGRASERDPVHGSGNSCRRVDTFLDAFPSVRREQTVAVLKLAQASSWIVRSLLDRFVPRQFATRLSGHDVRTIPHLGSRLT